MQCTLSKVGQEHLLAQIGPTAIALGASLLQHVLVHSLCLFRQTLELAARDLARDFPVAIGVQLRPATNPSELQQRFVVSVRNYLAQFIRDRQRMLDESQAAVDSPEEYARVSTACSQS